MKAVGIIAEYNPFHNGHAYQVAEVRRRESPDVVIVAMSGHFTQRGEASLFTKWQRAQLALAGGADLVVESVPCGLAGPVARPLGCAGAGDPVSQHQYRQYLLLCALVQIAS